MSDKLAEYYNPGFKSGESDSAPPPYSKQHGYTPTKRTQQPYAHPPTSEEQGTPSLHTPSAAASGSRGLADSYYQADRAHISPYTAQSAQYYPQQNSSSYATNAYRHPLSSERLTAEEEVY